MSRIELIILIVIIVIALPLLISFFDIQVTVGKTYGLENIGFPNVDIITWVENHPETVALIGVLIPIVYTLVNSFIKRRGILEASVSVFAFNLSCFSNVITKYLRSV